VRLAVKMQHELWLGRKHRLVVGVAGIGYGVFSDVKPKGRCEWVHMALANRKPAIQGTNQRGS
jgi:hypothetical protein